ATVTFAYLKPGLLFEPGHTYAGAIEVADIGIRADDPHAAIATVTTADDARRALGSRPPDGHKWNAAVLVVGGSRGMIGAPSMTARAAMRAGSGMVVTAVPGHEAAARVGGGEVVARAMPATGSGALAADAAEELLKGDIERFKAVAIGPGIGRAPET